MGEVGFVIFSESLVRLNKLSDPMLWKKNTNIYMNFLLKFSIIPDLGFSRQKKQGYSLDFLQTN
jgi:hypothetical protein